MTLAKTLELTGMRTMLGVLTLVTLVEWGIFAVRHEVPRECIVPALLGLSFVKFVMVIDWYTRLPQAPGRLARAIPTVLVVIGGTSLAIVASLSL